MFFSATGKLPSWLPQARLATASQQADLVADPAVAKMGEHRQELLHFVVTGSACRDGAGARGGAEGYRRKTSRSRHRAPPPAGTDAMASPGSARPPVGRSCRGAGRRRRRAAPAPNQGRGVRQQGACAHEALRLASGGDKWCRRRSSGDQAASWIQRTYGSKHTCTETASAVTARVAGSFFQARRGSGVERSAGSPSIDRQRQVARR